MWSCGFQSKHPVELVFHLSGVEARGSESHGLSKITVWNYNRGIKVSWMAASVESTLLVNVTKGACLVSLKLSHLIMSASCKLYTLSNIVLQHSL